MPDLTSRINVAGASPVDALTCTTQARVLDSAVPVLATPAALATAAIATVAAGVGGFAAEEAADS